MSTKQQRRQQYESRRSKRFKDNDSDFDGHEVKRRKPIEIVIKKMAKTYEIMNSKHDKSVSKCYQLVANKEDNKVDLKVNTCPKIEEIDLSSGDDMDDNLFEVVPNYKSLSQMSQNISQTFVTTVEEVKEDITESCDKIDDIIREKVEEVFQEINKDITKGVKEVKEDITTDVKEDIKELKNKNICVFCGQLSLSSELAKDHYLSHTAVGLECGQCHQSCPSLKTFRSHNREHMSCANILNLDDFKAAKKWSEEYVHYIQSDKRFVEDFVYSNAMFCPICHKLRTDYGLNATNDNRNKTSMKSPKIEFSDDFVRNHLHRHFQYFPYECVECHLEDKKTSFALIDDDSRRHLADVHKVDNVSDLKANELMAYFVRKKSMKKLDQMIEYCLDVSLNMNSLANDLRKKCSKKIIFKKT